MTLKEFLWPNKAKLAIFAVFLILVLLADIQAEGFTEGPRSSLYNSIKDFPFWVAMVYLALPAMVLTIPLASIGLGNLTLPVIIAYFYILSCVIDLIIQKFHRRV